MCLQLKFLPTSYIYSKFKQEKVEEILKLENSISARK